MTPNSTGGDFAQQNEPLSPQSIKALEDSARAATPGPWEYRPDEHDDWGWVKAGRHHIVATARGNPDDHLSLDEHRAGRSDPYEPNGRFLALANPATVLSLIGRIAELTEALTEARYHCRLWQGEPDPENGCAVHTAVMGVIDRALHTGEGT